MAPKETVVKLNLRFRESRVLLEEFKLGIWLVCTEKDVGKKVPFARNLGRRGAFVFGGW